MQALPKLNNSLCIAMPISTNVNQEQWESESESEKKCVAAYTHTNTSTQKRTKRNATHVKLGFFSFPPKIPIIKSVTRV